MKHIFFFFILGIVFTLSIRAQGIALTNNSEGKPRARAEESFRVSVKPDRVWVERKRASQFVSFDFRVENLGRQPLRVSRIELSVFDASGALIIQKFMTAVGLNHADRGIAVIEPKTAAFLFNPFDSFENDVELATLRYVFTFRNVESGNEVRSSVAVRPIIYRSKTRLSLPLRGRILVHDGHDFNSHHRRFSLSDPFLKEIGVTKNFTRFASDLSIVNNRGDLRRNASEANTDWYGFGATVFAPGAGVVVRVRNDVPDNAKGKNTLTLDGLRRDPWSAGGNQVVIDHLNGEYSFLAHFKEGSVLVRKGDRVRAGQPIGRIGVSGDAYMPHVHYELRDTGELNADGLPAYFEGFFRVVGAKLTRIRRSPIESGDILENR